MGVRAARVAPSSALALVGTTLLCFACGATSEEMPAPTPPPAPAPTAYIGSVVAEGGTIAGVATSTGDAVDEPVAITRDPLACGGGEGAGFSRPSGALLVSDGRVANVVVWLDGMTHGKPFIPATTTIDNVGCLFVPRVSIGFVGGKIVAHNSDSVLHGTSLSFVSDGKSIANLALPAAGAQMARSLRRPGLVSLRCDVHEWMQGWLHVFDHPYATLTDSSGAFQLTDIPAGSYTLKIWHERLGELSRAVTVSAGSVSTVDIALP